MSNRGRVFVGKSTQKLDSSPDWGAYSKVILKTSDEKAFTAGDDTGLTLEADCPYATQAIANAVLAKLNGVNYKPYTATKAIVTPAAEIGDAMTSDGFYSGIYSINQKFSRTNAMDIGAPCNTEVDHEIQYTSVTDRKFVRQAQAISAQFSILSDEINAKVSQEDGNRMSFGWSMTVDGMYWYANGTEIMRANSTGLKIIGTLESGSVITGSLTVGNTSITAIDLGAGAYEGNQWANGGGYGGGGSISGKAFTTTGVSNYNSATTQNTSSYPSYFTCGYLVCSNIGTPDIRAKSLAVLLNGSYYGVTTTTINGTTVFCPTYYPV